MRGTLYIAVAILLLGSLADTVFAGRRGALPGAQRPGLIHEQRAPQPGAEMRQNRDEVQAFIMEYFPDRARKLEYLRANSPEIFSKRRDEIVSKARRLMRLREEDPKMFHVYVDEIRLRDELDLMSVEWKKADSKERNEIETLIMEKLVVAFELRQQIKEDEVQRLESRLDDLKESLKRRSGKQKQLIEERFQDLTQSQNDEW